MAGFQATGVEQGVRVHMGHVSGLAPPSVFVAFLSLLCVLSYLFKRT